MAFKIEIGSAIDVLVKGLQGRPVAAIDEEVVDYLNGIKTHAQGPWPVDTGASRAAFRLTAVSEAGRRVFELRNEIGYAGFINHGETARSLLFRPFLAGAPALAQRVARRIAEG